MWQKFVGRLMVALTLMVVVVGAERAEDTNVGRESLAVAGCVQPIDAVSAGLSTAYDRLKEIIALLRVLVAKMIRWQPSDVQVDIDIECGVHRNVALGR